MNEFSFINNIKQKTYNQATLQKGIGDDAAVFQSTGQDVVTAVDVFVENIHFSRQTMEPFHIGYKALAANLSDLAAMGATPSFYLVSIVIPKTWSEVELLEIFSGMQTLAKYFKVDLIGGDTVSGNELTISITIIGHVKKGKARYRRAAKPGDIVFVTGTLGDSRAGLHILQSGQQYIEEQYFTHRHQLPEPRIHFSSALGKIPRLSLNDISDGLANEASEIAEASQVTIHLFDEKIPVHPSFHQFDQEDQQRWKYFGGEDFELLGTVSEENWLSVKKTAERTNIEITKIGYVSSGKENSGNVYVHKESNDIYHLPKKGYIHLNRW